MEVLIDQGKILYVGSSNFAGWHIAQANAAAAARGLLGLVSEQSLYNLLTRDIELEVLPAARAYGVGVIPWSPLQGGLLGGALRREQEGPSAGSRAGPRSRCARTGTRSRRSRRCATHSGRSRPSSRWRGCCTRTG
jgi:aryl-alcohol dehydrogenase-like predicted oxidoreductase